MTTRFRPATPLPSSARQPLRPVAHPGFFPAQLIPLLAFAACLGLAATTTPVQAQDSYTRALKDRVDRLQQELAVLQRQVYQGSGAARAAAGGSDIAPTQAARLELRMSQFEDALRRLTGNAEELSFRLNQVTKRLDDLTASVSQRLDQLESGSRAWSEVPADQSGAVADSGGSLGVASQPPAQTAGTAIGQAAAQGTGQGQGGLAPGPRTLGTVSAADLETLRARALTLQQGGGAAVQGAAAGSGGGSAGTTQAALQTPSLPGNTAKEKYDHAFGLLSQANYPAAEQALQAFLQQHPSDPLAGNAKYWLGETFYVRQLYKQAAVAFAEGFQQYPTSSKAPDNLLKLGKSLAALDQVADACGTYAELLNRFPTAPATILQQAKSERQRLACS